MHQKHILLHTLICFRRLFMKPTRPNILMHRWGLGLFWFWLLLGGCSGCGKHPAPEPPVAQPAVAPAAQRAVSDTDFFTRIRLWQPWEPTVLPSDALERTNRKLAPFTKDYEAGVLSMDAYQEKMYQISAVEVGNLRLARWLIDNDSDDKAAALYARRAYAENPDDFETLITFACRGGLALYGEEMTAAFRRLHEMQPAHPFVLHKLALCIYPTQPAEALGYAQKAQQLDARYLAFGAEGICYFQLGDYPAALAAAQRAYRAAPAKLKYHSGERIDYIEEVMKNAALQAIIQRKRERGIPLMYPAMWEH